MRNSIWKAIIIVTVFASVSHAGFLDDIFRTLGVPAEKGIDNETIVSGLKEALSVGTENAVTSVSALDGYFANEAIKILMPGKIQKIGEVMKKIGYGQVVDDFVVSMNRAAETAAPRARDHFAGAIKEMTFRDAKEILNGGDTAATEYFREKTSGKLYEKFRPIISSSMNEVGATRAYKDMIGKYTTLPFVKEESLDLDNYVTNKSLDGLFYMIAEEEKKIRTDPAARVTDLLKKVFTK